MKMIFLICMIIGLSSVAQNKTLSENVLNKSIEINKIENQIFKGCYHGSKQQPLIEVNEWNYNIDKSLELLSTHFSKAFTENPELEKNLMRDLDQLKNDSTCLSNGNKCRTQLYSTVTYYYQNLRPNLESCNNYEKVSFTDKKYDKRCELEIEFRTKDIDTSYISKSSSDSKAVYVRTAIDILNQVQNKLESLILNSTQEVVVKKNKVFNVIKSKTEFSMCNQRPDDSNESAVFSNPIRMVLNPKLVRQESSETVIEKKVIQTKEDTPKPTLPIQPEKTTCESKVIFADFVQLNFDEGRADVGNDQLDPVKQKINQFIESNENLKITKIEIVSSASKTPFSKDKVKSDQKNLDLAKSRSIYAEHTLKTIRIIYSDQLKDAEQVVNHALNGPQFEYDDLIQLKKIVPTDKLYKEKVKSFFNTNKEILKEQALITKYEDLLDSKRFKNLYEVKYKPYQGFKVTIFGYAKQECLKSENSSIKTNKKDVSPASSTGR